LSGRKEDEEQPKHPHPNDVSFFFYLANEEGCPLKLFPKQPSAISMQQDDLIASGSTKEIGGWELHTIRKVVCTSLTISSVSLPQIPHPQSFVLG
jgi:hypothetical protein